MEKNKNMINALTVDVEDYYQVEAFAEVVRSQDWECWESRVADSTQRLLDLFARHNIHGTFFVLGWLAERCPHLVHKIAAAGHEIACHGYYHRFIGSQTREEFRQDVRRAKAVLEDLTGNEIEGYRAPTYSITAETLWALEILIEEGFRYDSSIFPIHHDRYGIPDAKRFPHVIRCGAGEILEFPPSTMRLAGQNWPLVGGGYFRILPYGWFRWGLKQLNEVEQRPAIFMVHAWEVDPEQPRVPGKRLNVWRHRFNLHKTEPRLQRLLGDFQFSTVRDVLQLSERNVHVAEPSLIRPNPLYVHD